MGAHRRALRRARAEFERAASLTRNTRERTLLLERATTCGSRDAHQPRSRPPPAATVESDYGQSPKAMTRPGGMLPNWSMFPVPAKTLPLEIDGPLKAQSPIGMVASVEPVNALTA